MSICGTVHHLGRDAASSATVAFDLRPIPPVRDDVRVGTTLGEERSSAGQQEPIGSR